MDLKDKENALTAKKILFVKQLSIYSKLCSTYQRLAAEFPGRKTAKEIKDRYQTALSDATKSRIDKTDRPKYSEFTDEEFKLIKDFSNLSNTLNLFGDASAILDKAIHIKEGLKGKKAEDIAFVDPNKINEFHNFLRRPGFNSGINFDDNLQQHSRLFLSYQYNAIAKQSVENIDNIDQSHLQHPKKISGLTPESFGATIKGANGYAYTHDELKKKKNNLMKPIKQKAAKYIGTGLILAMTGMAAFSSINHANQAYQTNYIKNNIETVQQAQNLGIDTGLSNDLLLEIITLENDLDEAKNSSEFLSHEDLTELKDTVDNLFDKVVKEKTILAFKEKYPGKALEAEESAKLTAQDPYKVETSYDFTDPENPYIITFSHLNPAKKIDNPTNSTAVPYTYIADYDTDVITWFNEQTIDMFESEVAIDNEAVLNEFVPENATVSKKAKGQDAFIFRLLDHVKTLKDMVLSNAHFKVLGNRISFSGISSVKGSSLKALYESIKNQGKKEKEESAPVTEATEKGAQDRDDDDGR